MAGVVLIILILLPVDKPPNLVHSQLLSSTGFQEYLRASKISETDLPEPQFIAEQVCIFFRVYLLNKL